MRLDGTRQERKPQQGPAGWLQLLLSVVRAHEWGPQMQSKYVSLLMRARLVGLQYAPWSMCAFHLDITL